MRDRDHEIKNNNPRNIFKVSVFLSGEKCIYQGEKKGIVKG